MYKELFTWESKDDPLKFKPEPYLPRPWLFYADWGFWLVILILGTLTMVLNLPSFLGSIVEPAFTQTANPDKWVAWSVLAIFAFHPLLCFFVAYDSYRWNLPNRLIHVVLVCCINVAVFVYYINIRSRWVMEAQRQARMHRLGLHDV